MEYVCRVGTPSGDVVERSFSAPDERALRADLEQQGLYLLSIRRGLSLSGLRLRRPRVQPATLLVFSQELAALLNHLMALLKVRAEPFNPEDIKRERGQNLAPDRIQRP